MNQYVRTLYSTHDGRYVFASTNKKKHENKIKNIKFTI